MGGGGRQRRLRVAVREGLGAPLRAGVSRPNDANSRGNQQLIILIPERMVTAGGHQAGSPLSTSYSAGLRRKNRSELKVKAK